MSDLPVRSLQTIEQAAIGICHVDLDGRWLFVNQRLREIVGYTHEELLAVTFQDITHADDLETDLEYVQQLLKGEISRYSMEKRYIHQNGSIVWVGLDVSLVRHASGEPDYFISTIQDIGDRKQAEQMLQRQAQIFDQVKGSIVCTNLDGIITSWSRGSEELYGYPAEEAIGQPIQFLYREENQESWPHQVILPLQQNGEHEAEIVCRHKSGAEFEALLSLSLEREPAGKVVGMIAHTLDISERKRVEAALRQSEERFRSLMEACAQIIWNTNAAGELVTEQPSWSVFTGQSFEEYKSWGWLSAIHPDDRTHVDRVWSAAVANRSLYEVEFRMRRYDGEYRFMSCRAVPIVELGGTIREWIGANTDITERKQAEVTLKQSEERFRSLIEAASQIVWSTDATGCFVTDLPQWRAFTGQTLAEMLGWGWLKVIHPDDQALAAEQWTAALNTRTPYEAEIRIRRHDGKYRYMNVRSIPVLNRDGSIREWIGTNIDIHDRKQAEAALAESEAQFRHLVENATDLIWSSTLDGILTYISPSFQPMTGYDVAECLGHSFVPFVHVDDLSACLAFLQQVVETGEQQLGFEFRYIRKDSSWFWASSNVSPVKNEFGVVVGFQGIIQDIHERKQAEIALQEQKNLLQLILDSMSDGIIVADEQAKFLVFNPAAEQIHGGGSKESWGDEWSQEYGLFLPDQVTLFPPDQLPLMRAIKGEETKDVEMFVRHAQAPDGCWVLINGRPLRDESGQVKGGVITCRDITERKQAEIALQHKEERYRSLIAAIPQLVWTTDAEGRVSDMPAWRAFTGQTEAEVIGFGWLDSLHPEDRKRTAEVWMKSVQTKTLYDTEYRIRAADGSYRYFVARGVPVLGEDGKIQEWIGTSTDIQPQKEIEQTLRQTTEILDLAGDSIIIRDMSDRIVYWNQGAEKLYGWQREEVIGQYIHTFLQTRFPQPLATCLAEFFKEGHWEGELQHMTRNGQQIMVASRWTLQRDASGQPIAQLEINSDITQRKAAEIAIRQSEERLQAILDNSPAVFYMKDLEGRLILVNRQLEELLGLSRTEILGKRDHELFPQELADAYGLNDRRVLATRTAMQWEEQALQLDGLHTFLSLKFPLLAEDGSPYAVCGISTDITERKQAETALAQAKDAAEAASRAKSEFLANMSHELRTPLNGIMGYAQILQRSKLVDGEARSRVDIIYQCASHLLTLINDILDLSKIEAQKVELLPTDFHFPAFLQGVAEMCRIRAELKNIQFHYQLASELPMGIRADEKRLRQVLINLLSNAIKFTDNGSVTFTVSYASAGKIRFEVRDTGVGIPQELLEAIFQPFEQVGDTRRQTEGTGLGLAISQRIVNLMDSTIQVQSETGVGSIFWFDVNLPPAAEWVKTAQTDSYGQIIGIKDRQPKILVIDDKWENRSVVSSLLAPIGFDVTEAINGQEGWRKVEAVQPDLIITDLLMPEMDGFELIRHVRTSEKSKEIFIIVSSASVFETDQHRSIEAGGNEFLPKPIQATELLQKLQRLLNLEWIYEEETSINAELETDNLVAPPLEQLELLYELAMKGNFKGIIKYAVQIETMDVSYRPFAQKLQQFAREFQDEKILGLIQSCR